MIDTKIWGLGATSISVTISHWKADKITPAKFKCAITHAGSGPSAIIAERDTALAAERECCEAFIAHFSGKKQSIHAGTKALRPSEPAAKPEKVKPAKKADDFEY